MLRHGLSVVVVLISLLAPFNEWRCDPVFAHNVVKITTCKTACDLTCVQCISPCADCVCARLSILPPTASTPLQLTGSNPLLGEFVAPSIIMLAPDPPPPRTPHLA